MLKRASRPKSVKRGGKKAVRRRQIGADRDLSHIGRKVDQVEVQFGTRLLKHFSEQLYASPNKAFEELISNSWDAGATACHTVISDDLKKEDAMIMVLDNGVSMNKQGLHDLWKIAWSRKRDQGPVDGRNPIGKFGIGKLATYALATKLTYVCMAEDGIIRAVTMDYDDFERKQPRSKKVAVTVRRPMREISLAEVHQALQVTDVGTKIFEFIRRGVGSSAKAQDEARERWRAEYGSSHVPASPKRQTWTLAILGGLKPMGRNIQIGHVRRMLRAALPIGSDLYLDFCGEELLPSKIDVPIVKSWDIGPELAFDSFPLAPRDSLPNSPDEIKFQKGPGRGVTLPELGLVTGRVMLYRDQIAGGKSDSMAPSNGYHVNVLGRVVNHDDCTFGDSNLSHAAWSRVRITVRVDGLDAFLSTNREQFKQTLAVAYLRGFLRRLFNLARTHYDALIEGLIEDPDMAMSMRLGTLPQDALRSVLSSALEEPNSPLRSLLDADGVDDPAAMARALREHPVGAHGGVIQDIDFENRPPQEAMSRVRLRDGQLLINRNHAFVEENSGTPEQRLTLKSVALVNLMTDAHAAEIGVDDETVAKLRQYRDQIASAVARMQRLSGLHLARLLNDVHQFKAPHSLERLVGDALEYLGFSVLRLAQPGEPEGVATARLPAGKGGQPSTYSLTYDAKSTRHARAKTGNLNIAGLQRHRQNYDADYSLVVAPDFQDGAVVNECENCGVTPMRAPDLAVLLTYGAKYGPIPLDKLKEVFKLKDPDLVAQWVVDFEVQMTANRVLTLDLLLRVIEEWDPSAPDALTASVIADRCRKLIDNKDQRRRIKAEDVHGMLHGLAMFVPDLIRVDPQSEHVYLNVPPSKLAEAISHQLRQFASSPTDAPFH